MSACEPILPKVLGLPADRSRVREGSVADGTSRRSGVERLLVRWRPYDARRLTARELRVETAAALSFAAVALAMALLVPFSRPLDTLLAAALIVSLALASRVHLHLGAGFAVPTPLVLVPMLFLLPPEIVPLCVGLGLAGGALIGTLAGTEHPERIVTGTADAWYAVGAAAVFIAADAPPAELAYWAVPLVALFAQCAIDVLTATIREWLGRGIAPAAQVRVILTVYAIDACLTPVGFLVAMAATAEPLAFALVLPLLALLAALAADRGARIREAVDRLDQLTEEHARLDRAIHRIGEAFGSKLDRTALIDIGLRTAVEALGAQFGRANVAGQTIDHVAGPVTPAEAVAAAELAAQRTGALRVTQHGDHAAMARPLTAFEVLVVARRGPAFTQEEQALFGYLTRQTALAIENAALHDQLRRQATVDELTGLANHRRFHEALQQEAQRTSRSGLPTGLALIDIDDFKKVNDTYGHQFGDVVLEAVAGVVGRSCRATDVAARFGSDELALILSDTDIEGAWTTGESVRRAIEALELALPDGTPLRVTVSVGVSALEPGVGDVDMLIEAADIARHEAKRAGKNRTRSTGWAGAAGVAHGRPGNRFSRATSTRPLL
jgi:diguanylate cyclase (GGDEF)-like protein